MDDKILMKGHFPTVLVVNKPGPLKEFRLGESKFFKFNHKTNRNILLRQLKKRKSRDSIITDYCRLHSSFITLKNIHCLPLSKFPLPKIGIVKLNETPLHVQ